MPTEKKATIPKTKPAPNALQVNDRSIEAAGLPNEYPEAIAEFIWNSFDAGASTVSVDFVTESPIGHVDKFSISDNGSGISPDTLSSTFGVFLDSLKRGRSFQRSSYTHGRKGKGRFSFEVFSSLATWKTVYSDADECREFEVSIKGGEKDQYVPTVPKAVKKAPGTVVTFSGVHGLGVADLTSPDFKNYLKFQFGWFLHLNRGKDFRICINGEQLTYQDIIADAESSEIELEDSRGQKVRFKINYVRWGSKIGEKYYFYYLRSDCHESGKRLTSFNNKGDEFHHSVYVESDYFDSFTWPNAEDEGVNETLLGRSTSDKAFRALSGKLENLLSAKRREFIRANSEKIVSRFEEEGVMPRFNQNKYDEARREDFEEVVRELYSVEPKIFMNLGKEQKQTFLGLLNLVLDTEERESVMKIIDGVVKLGAEDRKSLANILGKTTLSRITRTMRLIEDRYEAVETLRALVFDLKKFTNERNHIQKVIEENYWLFGEQYNLISADQTFEDALSEYLHIVDGAPDEKTFYKMDHPHRKRRPDIFLCRKRITDDPQDEASRIEESVIVELKAPSVILTNKEFRQVEDYLNVVTSEDRFNSSTRQWKFYLVSNKISSEVTNKYKAFADKGKRHLVYQVDKFEIYAMTWDDVFRFFDIRHQFISEKLEFDKRAIQEELKLQGIDFSREAASELVGQVLRS